MKACWTWRYRSSTLPPKCSGSCCDNTTMTWKDRNASIESIAFRFFSDQSSPESSYVVIIFQRYTVRFKNRLIQYGYLVKVNRKLEKRIKIIGKHFLIIQDIVVQLRQKMPTNCCGGQLRLCCPNELVCLAWKMKLLWNLLHSSLC